MPKATFNNLSEVKKRRIFSAAVSEFAQRRFSEASINQVVKASGISRGSFYQYFEGKEDLYLYVLNAIAAEKMQAVLREEAAAGDVDFFSTYEHMVKLAFAWARQKPEYSQIGLLMKVDDSTFISKLRGTSDESKSRLVQLVERDKARGLIKPDIDSQSVIDLLYGALTWFQMHEPKEQYSEDRILEMLGKAIAIIKGGISLV